jgi:3-hydroxyisobutyrate dehydrogenase-like beta-hydroxyacid dehydrogenase
MRGGHLRSPLAYHGRDLAAYRVQQVKARRAVGAYGAQQAHEREYARQADAVITVSEKLADLLVSEHGLATRPTVVFERA